MRDDGSHWAYLAWDERYQVGVEALLQYLKEDSGKRRQNQKQNKKHTVFHAVPENRIRTNALNL